MTTSPVVASSSTAADWDITEMFASRRNRPLTTTLVDFGHLAPAIARAMATWGVADLMSTPPRDIPLPTTPVDAVDYVARVLQVRRERVLTASGIAERTFFGWKSDGRRPREGKVRTLWTWVQVLSRLRTSRPGIAMWFQSDDAAQAAFDQGDMNAFLAAEMHSALRGRVPESSIAFDLLDDEAATQLAPSRPFSPQPVRRVTLARG